MKSEKKTEYLNQIRNEYLYIKKVLESCKTSEQVKITGQWYNRIIEEKWEFQLKKICNRNQYIFSSSYIEEHWKLNREIATLRNLLWELSIKMYEKIMLTPKHRYLVQYTDAWDDYIHNLQAFDTKEEAEAFIAEKEHWKQEFKDEFGVDYNSLRESDFTNSMEDWLNEFVNKNDNLEEIQYFIDEI